MCTLRWSISEIDSLFFASFFHANWLAHHHYDLRSSGGLCGQVEPFCHRKKSEIVGRCYSSPLLLFVLIKLSVRLLSPDARRGYAERPIVE